MPAATVPESRVRESDWIRCIIRFLKDEGAALPSDAQTTHLAFMRLQDEFPEVLGHYRFIPDPVVPRSERLQSILSRLQLTTNASKPNPEYPTTSLSKLGASAVDRIVVQRLNDEQVTQCRRIAKRLSEVLRDYEADYTQ